MSPPWDALLRELDRGEILTPDSAAYGAAHRGFNARFHNIRPRAIVRCTTPEEVACALAFAKDNRFDLAVRSGGHCFAGHSTTTGVVIDVSGMRSVDVSRDVAVIGAGATLGDVYAVLDGLGRTIPGGTCPQVGIAGLTLGGGLGILGRQHGVTCDSLIAARVVLASGEILDCDERRDADLFWALRGAGAGNFGVVTSLSLRTVQAPAQTWTRNLRWPASAAAEVIDGWQRWAPAAPGEVAASLKITATGISGASASVDVYATGVGTQTSAQVTAGLISEIKIPPTATTGPDGPFAIARRFWADLGTDGTQRSPAHSPVPAQPWLLCRSEFFTEPLPSEAIGTLLDAFTAGQEPGVSRELDFMPWGGAYCRPNPSDTAFVHRDGLFQLKHSAVVEPALADEARGSARTWVDRSWSSVHPWGTGRVFPNFADRGLQEAAECYYASNLHRLRSIKQEYDPGNTFRFSQSIPLP